MAAWAKQWRPAVVHLGLLGLAFGWGLAGCGGQAPAPEPEPPQAAASAKDSQASAAAQVPLDPRLHQPFEQAVSLEPPDGQMRPPDTTKAGKSTGKLFDAVVAHWDQIKFATPAGKRLNYTATIKTDLGTVVLELWPDVAPNHVRSFVALARAGYYDGLDFDRVYREELVDAKGTFLEYAELGCPLGTGEPGYGSIGYWLKPELSSQIKHEEGTVGAWHAEEVESAACKLYITLTRAPWMDGNFTVFGKVAQGLAVVRAIAARPKRSDDPLEDRPREPVVIRQVTIQTSEAARATGPAN
jgi:peptidyl-prolyl cis-trans isomerase B (cyclophilin B)